MIVYVVLNSKGFPMGVYKDKAYAVKEAESTKDGHLTSFCLNEGTL